eukprot:510760-Rhodomonas_salina.1
MASTPEQDGNPDPATQVLTPGTAAAADQSERMQSIPESPEQPDLMDESSNQNFQGSEKHLLPAPPDQAEMENARASSSTSHEDHSHGDDHHRKSSVAPPQPHGNEFSGSKHRLAAPPDQSELVATRSESSDHGRSSLIGGSGSGKHHSPGHHHDGSGRGLTDRSGSGKHFSPHHHHHDGSGR